MQSDTALLFIKSDIVLLGYLLTGYGIHIQKILHHLSLTDVQLHDPLHIIQRNHAIEGIFGIDLHKRSLGAESEASCQIHHGLSVQPLLGKNLRELLHDLL